MTEYPGPPRFRLGLRTLVVLLFAIPPLIAGAWAFWRYRQQTVGDTASIDLFCGGSCVFALMVAGLMIGASLLGDYFNKDRY